jgi:hypothetical protein
LRGNAAFSLPGAEADIRLYNSAKLTQLGLAFEIKLAQD